MLIKQAGGEFVQWGEESNECHPQWDEADKVFGPDVQYAQSDEQELPRPLGIFGLDHSKLLKSEWIENDTLTVKVLLQVMGDSRTETYNTGLKVDIPPPTILENVLSLLEEGTCSDVTFSIEGHQIKAHSAILCARSEVFERELNCGLQESMSREIEIKDFDLSTFKALLRFLYTDDFATVEELVKREISEGLSEEVSGSSSSSSNEARCSLDIRIAMLQNILAASHKYQVSRLRLWCEQQLCERISKTKVCSILCQAHLFEAQQLERICLSFIKENMETVVATPGFGSLGAEWPEVMLKINVNMAGLTESAAAPAIGAQAQARAQKRQKLEAFTAEETPTEGAKRRREE